MSEEQKQKFPSEVVDLPSGGKIYGKDSPLYDGKIEIKYMTAREEDILTSQNLIKKGIVIEKLLDSLILSEGVKSNDLLIGDKNAIMVAARILAYGAEYTVNVQDPNTGEDFQHTFDLTKCPFKHFPDGVNPTKNEFSIKLPISKSEIKFRLLTGKLENIVSSESEAIEKTGISAQLTTRLRHTILSVDGNDEQSTITNFVNNMLARDSMALRQEIVRLTPDIDLSQEVDRGGETVMVDIPLTVTFFWPTAQG
tara:strand:+ start:269 stop:1027 length:759 start_codon:yes stop_codon:yes gene_type:complete